MDFNLGEVNHRMETLEAMKRSLSPMRRNDLTKGTK